MYQMCIKLILSKNNWEIKLKISYQLGHVRRENERLQSSSGPSKCMFEHELLAGSLQHEKVEIQVLQMPEPI